MVGFWDGSGWVVDVTGSTFALGSELAFVFGSGLGSGLSIGIEVVGSLPEFGFGLGLGISVGVGVRVGVDVLVGL